MYHIVFQENGRFVTEIGGPLRTLAEAVEQISKLSEGTGCSPIDGIVGCKWVRGGVTTCDLFVVNDLFEIVVEK